MTGCKVARSLGYKITYDSSKDICRTKKPDPSGPPRGRGRGAGRGRAASDRTDSDGDDWKTVGSDGKAVKVSADMEKA